MIRGYTAQQVRDAEKPHLTAGEPLMQRAAHALAGRILALLETRPASAPRRALLLIGSGDNGGDALFAGAELARAGAAVDAIGVGSRMHEAGRAEAAAAGVNFLDADAGSLGELRRSAGAAGTTGTAETAPTLRGANGYDVIVDGILGTGTAAGAPALRGVARKVVVAIRAALLDRGPTAAATGSERDAAGPLVVAVDIPSGIDPDSGASADDAVLPADLTVTFGGIKAGLLRGDGARLAGRVALVEIGIEADLAAMTPAIELP